MKEVRRKVFIVLAKLNKLILPSVARKDLNRLSKSDKILIAWRYWVTKNSYRD